MSTHLSRTHKALLTYDARKDARVQRLAAATTDDDVCGALSLDVEEENLVREAFFEDTKHVNSRDHAFLVHPDDPWLRTLVEKYGSAS